MDVFSSVSDVDSDETLNEIPYDMTNLLFNVALDGHPTHIINDNLEQIGTITFVEDGGPPNSFANYVSIEDYDDFNGTVYFNFRCVMSNQ